jgi:hypothetical protein
LESELNLDTRPTIPPQVISREVGDDTVLLDLATGMYFGVDGVARRIWESISEGRNLAETAELIASEYEVDEANAQADVLEFVSDLVERGLLAE